MSKAVLMEVRDALKAQARTSALITLVKKIVTLLNRVAEVGNVARKTRTDITRLAKAKLPTRGTHNISKKGRSRIAAAQKKRWVAYRKAHAHRKLA
jgi:hypothetical protein